MCCFGGRRGIQNHNQSQLEITLFFRSRFCDGKGMETSGWQMRERGEEARREKEEDSEGKREGDKGDWGNYLSHGLNIG